MLMWSAEVNLSHLQMIKAISWTAVKDDNYGAATAKGEMELAIISLGVTLPLHRCDRMQVDSSGRTEAQSVVYSDQTVLPKRRR